MKFLIEMLLAYIALWLAAFSIVTGGIAALIIFGLI
jgi:hypothetical protein